MLPLVKTAVVLLMVVAGCSGTHRSQIGNSSSVTSEPAVAVPPSTEEGARITATRPAIIGAPVSTEGQEITLEEVRQHVHAKTAVFVDAREEPDFRRGHVRGAINLPVTQLNKRITDLRQRIAPNDLVIIYCAGTECDASDAVYQFLLSQGYTNLQVFRPGWAVLGKVSDLQ